MRGSASFSEWLLYLCVLQSFAKHQFLNQGLAFGAHAVLLPPRQHTQVRRRTWQEDWEILSLQLRSPRSPSFTQRSQMKKLENSTGTNSHVILQPVITLSQTETSEEPLPGLDCNRSDGKDH